MFVAIGERVNGNYNTDLFNVIQSLPSSILYNNEHELREPKGIYSVSSSRVFRAFKNVLQEISDKNIDFLKIDLAHKELMDAIMAYIDDGYLIMKCFYHKSQVKEDIIFQDKWLRKVDNKLIEEYKQNIEPYRRRLALIDNKIKHNHARYCHVKVSSIYGTAIGYFIEGVNEDGVIEPNRDIHPIFNGQSTAISYNKDIRDLIVNFYFISYYIAHTIEKIIQKIHGITLEKSKCAYDGDKSILDIFQSITSLKELFFPDEFNDELSQITINPGKIELRKPPYKSYLSKLLMPTSIKVQSLMSGDGVTRSWAIPYF